MRRFLFVHVNSFLVEQPDQEQLVMKTPVGDYTTQFGNDLDIGHGFAAVLLDHCPYTMDE